LGRRQSRIIEHDGVLEDGQLLGTLFGCGKTRIEGSQGGLVGGRRLTTALMVVRLPEQQPVESGWRVVVRLPATAAAFVTAACTSAIHGTAVATTAIAPAVTTEQ